MLAVKFSRRIVNFEKLAVARKPHPLLTRENNAHSLQLSDLAMPSQRFEFAAGWDADSRLQ